MIFFEIYILLEILCHNISAGEQPQIYFDQLYTIFYVHVFDVVDAVQYWTAV